MAAQLASSDPLGTQALLTVLHFGLASEMAAQVASSLPLATHVLAVFVEHTSVPVQPLSPTHMTKVPTVAGSAPGLQTLGYT